MPVLPASSEPITPSGSGPPWAMPFHPTQAFPYSRKPLNNGPSDNLMLGEVKAAGRGRSSGKGPEEAELGQWAEPVGEQSHIYYLLLK